MNQFGQLLRKHREAAGLSLRQLGAMVPCSYSLVSKVERGIQAASEQFARACDAALHAHGVLIDAYVHQQAGDIDMHRRTMLQTLVTLAAAPASSVRWEALRHSVAAAVGADHDRWAQVVADYGHAYYRVSGDELMDNLAADLQVLSAVIAAEHGPGRERLLSVASRLSVVVALSMVVTGNTIAAGRWWRDAHQYADASRERDTILLSHAWDVVNGCYDGRTPAQVVALSDQVLHLTAGSSSAAACGLLAGRAQALSLSGRHVEAIATVRQLSDRAEGLPGPVIDDVDGLWGWPEHRLRHTETWVYAHAGRLNEATLARDRALRLYPPALARLRAQVQLHHAAALIRGGDVPDGLNLATDVLDDLPAEHHNKVLRAVAGQVVAAVPGTEWRRPEMRELADRVTA
ncbi:helix-turn-helix domain-containing protein [Salinispora mooreana]|uniref:helix-turn-helix domain-containing protein n=1 Tax=Salinispora mooreana TaxID=999545 RepID=UPI0006ACC1C5|nr:helix-turn-helix transcriptional regulator [Salinispora mooreana]